VAAKREEFRDVLNEHDLDHGSDQQEALTLKQTAGSSEYRQSPGWVRTR